MNNFNDDWQTGGYLQAIRPSTYEPVVASCSMQGNTVMVCNVKHLAYCPPVYIAQKAVELGIEPEALNVQLSYIASYASIPPSQPEEIIPEVVSLLVKWGLEVIRLDRWLMNHSEVTFESIVHFLSICRSYWTT